MRDSCGPIRWWTYRVFISAGPGLGKTQVYTIRADCQLAALAEIINRLSRHGFHGQRMGTITQILLVTPTADVPGVNHQPEGDVSNAAPEKAG